MSKYFNDYFGNCDYKKDDCDFGYNKIRNDEINKRLELIHKIDRKYYDNGKARVKNPKQRDEFLGEIMAIYYCKTYLGGSGFKIEPGGKYKTKLDYSYVSENGERYYVEVKSPSYRNEIWKDSSLNRCQKLMRAAKPKYINEARSFSPRDAIEHSIENALPKFKEGDQNILFITPNMFVDVYETPRELVEGIVKEEIERQDNQMLISSIIILEDQLSTDGKKVKYEYSCFNVNMAK